MGEREYSHYSVRGRLVITDAIALHSVQRWKRAVRPPRRELFPFLEQRRRRIGQPGRIFAFVRYFEVSRANRLFDASIVLVARNGPVPSRMSEPAHCDQ